MRSGPVCAAALLVVGWILSPKKDQTRSSKYNTTREVRNKTFANIP